MDSNVERQRLVVSATQGSGVKSEREREKKETKKQAKFLHTRVSQLARLAGALPKPRVVCWSAAAPPQNMVRYVR